MGLCTNIRQLITVYSHSAYFMCGAVEGLLTRGARRVIVSQSVCLSVILCILSLLTWMR